MHMKQRSSASMSRSFIDFVVVTGVITLCLLTAYCLVNHDFVFIYGTCFVCTAVAVWCLSVDWLKNMFVFLSALLLGLAVAEAVLSFAEPGGVESGREVARYTKGYSEPLRQNGGELGFRPYPSRSVRSWKTLGNERIYDVVYTINEDGYRQTTGFMHDEDANAPIVFYGGSFAFGEGVNDDETLPYFVGIGTDWSHPVLNLAFSGYGPHQMLRSLELEIPRSLGYALVDTVVYEAVPDHARRAAGDAWWDPVGPGYVLDDTGSAQYSGSFNDIPDKFIEIYYRYLQVVEVARRSRVVDWMANLLAGTPASSPEANVQLMVGIVVKSARIVEQDYHARFVVLFWDDKSEYSSLILKSLEEENISVIKVSDIIPVRRIDAYKIPGDGHPTSRANLLIAQGLIERLRYGLDNNTDRNQALKLE